MRMLDHQKHFSENWNANEKSNIVAIELPDILIINWIVLIVIITFVLQLWIDFSYNLIQKTAFNII